MRSAALTLHLHSEETLRNLARAAEALGVSIDALAEAAIERELAVVGAGLEGRLARALKGLESYGPEELNRDIRDFARSEVEIDDPLKARRIEVIDDYGIGAIFGDPVGRG
jgi:hypothetical protein